MNFFPLHVGDWISATAHLTAVEECMYARMVNQYYLRESPLPVDVAVVCRLVRASSAAERKAVTVVLGEFFTQSDDGWHQGRCDEEISKWREKAAKASESAQQRWSKRNTPAMPTDMRTHVQTDMRTHCDGNANQEPRTKRERKGIPARTPKTPVPDGFAVSDRVRSWAQGKGLTALLDERLEHFVSKCRAMDYRYVDWDEAFMEAIRKDWAGLDGKVTAMTAARRVAL